ncbi:MAG TPA: hypothetical protein HA223_00570 [Nanoarchaeota archaeon]|nr:hypothetical protein [Nanoarchaeota archaeon]
MKQELISISKRELEQMKQELVLLRNSKVYRRLLEFEKNISEGKSFTRKDLGF